MRTLRSLLDRPLAGAYASKVVRPRFPPVLVCALAWFASSAVLYPQLQDLSSKACTILCACAVLATIGGSVIVFHARRVALIGLAFGVCMGVACAAFGAARLHAQEDALLDARHSDCLLEVKEDAQKGRYGHYCVCKVEETGALIRLYIPDEYAHLRYGDVISANVTFSMPSKAAASTYWRLGHACSAKATRITLVDRPSILTPLLSIRNVTLDNFFAHAADDEAGMIARALLCGYRSGLTDSPIYLDFQAAGLAHMVAISGAHLTLVCGVIAALLSRLKVRRSAFVVIELGAIGCYLVIAAAPVSALRAAVMACTALMSFFVKRRKASLNALGLSMVALMLIHPQNCVSISFALSVAATLGIVVFFPLVSEWLSEWLKPVPAAIRDTLALTLTANLSTMTISAAMFSKVSLISPLSNCVCAPLLLVTCTVGCFVLIASFLIPPLSWAGVLIVQACSQALCWTVHALAAPPYACVAASVPLSGAVVATAAACVMLWMLWPRVPLGVACASFSGIIALAVAWISFSSFLVGTRIVMLDVGQGDAFLVQSGGKTALIDTGNDQNKLLSGLAQHNVNRIDCVIISHSDDDHCGCLRELFSCAIVDSIIVDEWTPQCGCRKCTRLLDESIGLCGADNVKTMGVGDVLRIGDITLEAIGPDSFIDEGGNADSLCLLARADIDHDGSVDQTALFCGDAESEQLKGLVAKGRLSHVDILKVGHHGSKDAVDAQLLDTLQPSIALISVGEYNEYGHPAAQTLQALEDAGTQVFRSDDSGSVTCKLESSKLIVSHLG